MDRWAGKVAIVTGASAGIGASIAEKLVEEGLIVVGLARRNEAIKEMSKKLSNKKGKLYAVKADLSIEADILNAFAWTKKTLGPIHVLVNNAGINQATTLVDGDTATWKKILDVNVLGLCIATREAVKSMRENQIDGHIININSLAGHRVPTYPEVNVYPASKYAVTALTETLRQELNRFGTKIKVTSISPGAVKTEIAVAGNIKPEVMKMFQDNCALESEDLANAVLYTLSTPPHVQVHEITIRPIISQ